MPKPKIYRPKHGPPTWRVRFRYASGKESSETFATRDEADAFCRDIDDVGTTVTSVMSVSAAPPLVGVALTAAGYPAEVLADVGSCGLSVLAADQAILASRFASAGRPRSANGLGGRRMMASRASSRSRSRPR